MMQIISLSRMRMETETRGHEEIDEEKNKKEEKKMTTKKRQPKRDCDGESDLKRTCRLSPCSP